MSDSTLTAAGGPPKVTRIQEAIIRIAGNSQDGIQAIGGFLARLAGRSEQEVMTFMTIPSTISGGPSIFQVRIGSGEVLSAGDEADMLVVLNDTVEDQTSRVRLPSRYKTATDLYSARTQHVQDSSIEVTVPSAGGAVRPADRVPSPRRSTA